MILFLTLFWINLFKENNFCSLFWFSLSAINLVLFLKKLISFQLLQTMFLLIVLWLMSVEQRIVLSNEFPELSRLVKICGSFYCLFHKDTLQKDRVKNNEAQANKPNDFCHFKVFTVFWFLLF